MAITRTGRLLGRRLKRLRGKRSLRDVEATGIAGSTATIRRLEAGEGTTLTFPAIGRLAEYYGAPAGLCLELEEMYKTAQRNRPWGDDFNAEVISGFPLFIELENLAAELKFYEPSLVIGLLQTEDYAESLDRKYDADASTMAGWKEKRRRRLTAFWERDELPSIQVLIGEWVLRGPLSAEQHDRLRSDQADVRVLAIADTPHPFVRGPFALMGFPGYTGEPDCLYSETIVGSEYEEEPRIVATYHQVFDRLFSRATPIEEF